MSLEQSIVWTALPNGWSSPGKTLALSVFVAPRLSSSAKPPFLTPFDFANWPSTLSNQKGSALKFSVTFKGHAPVAAAITSAQPNPRLWSLIFRPAETRVDPWKFKDLSGAPLRSFSVTGVEDFVRNFYTAVGKAYPTTFPPASLLDKYLPADENNRRGGPGYKYVKEAVAFHQLPPTVPAGTVHDPRYKPPIPTFDFHAILSALHSYPALMRMLGLVLDLEVTVPGGLTPTPLVNVAPEWKTLAVPGTLDVSPWTACRLTGSSFRAAPRGPDYGNGMLSLNDTKRFSVVELDTDGAADRISALATAMLQTIPPPGSKSNATPALRSAGPSVIWSGWAEQPSKGAGLDLSDMLTNQKANNAMIEAYISSLGVGPLPTFHAEDLIRGHRFDVLTTTEVTPSWRSLCLRVGTYRLGPKPEHVITIDDEGAVSAAVSQPAALVKFDAHKDKIGPAVPTPPDLYAHERIVKWKGWSLVAERPGKSGVGPGTELQENGSNPVPPYEAGAIGRPPLLSVTVAAPTTGSQLLPKLRFGDFYRFRARAADLAGNGVGVSSTDGSTATAPVPHLRFEPVESPHLAAISPPVPGEGTQLMVILDDQVNPVPTNGRWIFPPKVSQLMAEELGMLDGFVEGMLADPTKPPSGAPATYTLLAKRDPARLNDVPGVEFYGANTDSAGKPGVGSPYFPGAMKLAVPWIPDPLSAGVSMVGIPGATDPVVRFWEGGPWPDPEPLLLVLQAGATAGESYTAGTPAHSPVETITLPAAETAFVAMSSALYPGAVGPAGRLLGLYVLGPWQWLAGSGLTAKQLSDLEAAAVGGLLWQLSPARVLTLIHAVRIPLAPPKFVAPATTRTLGSTKAELEDKSFSIDVKSTSSLDVLAAWIDPVDDVTKPAPGLLKHTANAFKLTVDDGFVLGGTAATQDFGDTHHHLVGYHGVGTSRFSGYFRQTTTVTFSGTTPVELSTLGLAPASVRLTIPGTPAIKFPRKDFAVDAKKGTVALSASGVTLAAGRAVDVSWIPTDTLAGPAAGVPVLSTARPVAPTVARVVPAWQLSAPSGTLASGGILQTRRGNFLRVYLERPWYSTGAGELLGVVTRLDSQLPDTAQLAYTTVVGADPIYDALFADWGAFTGISSLTNLAKVPSVPGRAVYTSPPTLAIPEDPSGLYRIWPYEVRFDTNTRRWFADVQLSFQDQGVVGPDGAYPPMFVRLALTRFQPWSLNGVEVSPVVLATIAQPVPDRVVLVTNGTTPGTVQVQVEGFGYVGWRPAAFNSPGDYNSGVSPDQDYPETYGGPTMIVEVQFQDTSTGLSGDFAWKTVPGTRPVMLPSPGDNGAFVSWSGEVPLPSPSKSVPGPFRLCISEIDFYTEPTAPALVDTTYRRPFVVHVPLT